MRQSGSQIVHAFVGSQPVEHCAPLLTAVHCWLCGAPALRGIARAEWMGAMFVGQNRVRDAASMNVCEGCVYVCARLSPVPGRPPKEGKQLGGNFRNYSHLWTEAGGYANASKGEKPVILEFLRREKRGAWFAAIADSGQKHTLPWVPINPDGGPGRILFEERELELPRPAGWAMVDDLASLLTAGATKDDVRRGDYSPGAWMRCPVEIRAFESQWGEDCRGSGWFDLALFLAQRDEDTVQARMTAEQAARATKPGGKQGRKGKR